MSFGFAIDLEDDGGGVSTCAVSDLILSFWASKSNWVWAKSCEKITTLI